MKWRQSFIQLKKKKYQKTSFVFQGEKETPLPKIDLCETKHTNPAELWGDWWGGRLSLGWWSKITNRPFFFIYFKEVSWTRDSPLEKNQICINRQRKTWWEWRKRPKRRTVFEISERRLESTTSVVRQAGSRTRSEPRRGAWTISKRWFPLLKIAFFPFYFQLSLTSFCSLCVSSHLPLWGQADCEAKRMRWKNGQLAAAGCSLPSCQW